MTSAEVPGVPVRAQHTISERQQEQIIALVELEQVEDISRLVELLPGYAPERPRFTWRRMEELRLFIDLKHLTKAVL